MMTDEELDRAQPVIEMAQRLHTGLHAKLCQSGVEPIDALIAAIYSTHYLATAIHGPVGAVDWMRDALDAIEHQMLSAVARH